MNEQNLYLKLNVLETLAKVNQSGHKCNTEIKELIEDVVTNLQEVVVANLQAELAELGE